MCPTLTVGSFFKTRKVHFFVQFICSTTWGRFKTRRFKTLEISEPCAKQKKETNGRPGKHNKGPKLDISNFFFGTVRLFSKYFLSPKGPPSIFFKIICSKLKFQKAQRVSIFTILKTWRFLSLRYSADFRRSRLV